MVEMQTRIMHTRSRMPQVIDDILKFRVGSVEDDSFTPRPILPVTSMDGPTQDYVERVRLALSQVDGLMSQVDVLCDAWPSLHALKLEFPTFADMHVVNRLKTLQLWKHITTDLNSRMKLVAKVLGLNSTMIDAHWHFVDVDKMNDMLESASSCVFPREGNTFSHVSSKLDSLAASLASPVAFPNLDSSFPAIPTCPT